MNRDRSLSEVFIRTISGGIKVPTDQMGVLLTKNEAYQVVEVLMNYINHFPESDIENDITEFEKYHFPERFGLVKQVEKKTREKRPGFVYLFTRNDGSCKIGISKMPEKRLRSIQIHAPSVRMIHYFQSDDMSMAEKELHELHNEKRIKGEWFALSDRDISAISKISEYKDGEFIREIDHE